MKVTFNIWVSLLFENICCAFQLFPENVPHITLGSNDPDVNRDVPQLINSRGFFVETHYVTTADGYILTIHRIVNPRVSQTRDIPVILQHEFLGSGDNFIFGSYGGNVDEIVTPFNVGTNLGFELSKRAYDVWLTNSRGNKYGVNHTRLNPKTDKAFWEFSFDAMVDFDVSATIDYIRSVTRKPRVSWVGHSQGTMIMFGLLSLQPQYADIVQPFIALAPVTFLGHVKGPIQYVARNGAFQLILKLNGGPFALSEDINRFLALTCPLTAEVICSNLLFLFMGFDFQQLNASRIPVYAAHVPAGSSAWNFLHGFQMVKSYRFTRFDYGVLENRKRYGRDTPPDYPLEKITSKNIVLMSSKNDWLGPPEDVDLLRRRLTVPLLWNYVVPHDKWNHIDFISGIEAGKYVNSHVINILDRF